MSAIELGIGIVPYSPLGRGFLTGQVKQADLGAGDFRLMSPRFQGENFQKNLELVTRVEQMASEKKCTPAQLALAWVLAKGETVVPIPGTKRRKYLEDNLGALDVSLTAADLSRIEQIAPRGVAVGARYPRRAHGPRRALRQNMRRGRRKVEDPAMARRILAAAEQHFAEQGLAGARTEEIATEARANKAMLYYYFGSKRRLHRAVLENLLGQLRSRVLAPPKKNVSAGEQFFSYISEYFDFLAAHPNYPRLVQREAMEAGRKFEWIVGEFFRPLHREVARTVEEGVVRVENFSPPIPIRQL